MSQQHSKAPAADTTAASQKPALARSDTRVRKKKKSHTLVQPFNYRAAQSSKGFDSDTAGDGAVMPTEKLLSEQRKRQHRYSSRARDSRGNINTERLSKSDSTVLLKSRHQ